MRARIQANFFHYGWLLPLLLPLAQVGGRALVNVSMLVYLLWALIAVPGSRIRVERPAILLLAALLLAYLLGAPGALDTKSAFHEWVKFALHASAFYFTLVVLTYRPEAVDRMVQVLGAVGVALLTLLFVKLLWDVQQPGFAPTEHMKEDNLPFLLPFSLYYLMVVRGTRAARVLGGAVLVAVLAYVALSHGRAALAGMIGALLLYGLFVLRWHPGKVALAVAALLTLAVGLSYETFFRSAATADWVAWLDRFTSYRSQVWRQALEHPPANPLFGVGMANAGEYAEVVSISADLKLGHLHNFLLDAWYETGLLGLSALLVFVAVPCVRGWRLAREGGDAGSRAGLFLASAAALLIAGLLSFSYASRQFALYLPMLFAALWVLSGRPREPAAN